MDRVFSYIGRFAAIVFGFFVATLAASLFLHVLTLPVMGITTEEAPWAAMGGLVVSVPFIALFIGYFAFFPAAIAIALSELSGRRGFLFHCFAGVAVAVATGMLFQRGGRIYAPDFGPDVVRVNEPLVMGGDLALAVIATGLVAGITYWMIAGRSAGSWREIPAD